MVRTRSALRALWRWPNTSGRNGRGSIYQRESVGMSGGHQRPHAFVRIRAGVCRPVRPYARVELRMLRTGAGQHEDMEALFATQLRAFGDVTGRPLAGTSGRRHLGGHDSWPPLDAAQWIWLAA